MKSIRIILILMVLTTVLSPLRLKAVDWSRVVDLEGSWYFTVGDNPSWSDPGVSTDDWDQIPVPCKWEEYYEGYNGYAWYRRNFEVKAFPPSNNLVLFMGQIDDVDEVFVNGVKVGQTGSFFPNYKSAWNVQRKYELPNGLLKQGKNTIAVRVYDEGLDGGIRGGRIGIYFDNDVNLLSFNLSGKWKFSPYRERNCTSEKFDDSQWPEINVPGKWETQGYPGYDGYAWYRKKFTLPSDMQNQRLYIVLGKIDDMDKVYINGELIGQTEDLKRYREYNRSNSWRMYRAYPIPQGVLKEQNTIVVQVYDKYGDGGIYEGPVGLAQPEDARALLERETDDNSFNNFWSIIDYIFNN
jgi:hypothetical protein